MFLNIIIINNNYIVFYFHYLYNDKLSSSKVFKHDYGFDIKNNTVITMPPSYYNYVDKL